MAETEDAQLQAQKPAAAALQAKLNQGMALHRQGKLADAERCYGEVLHRQPNHFGAMHLLGVIFGQTGRTKRAVELIKRAVWLNPKIAEAHNNLGNALRGLKRYEEALASYDKAIVLKQDYANAHNNRGNALRDLKRPEEALASYDRAIALKPDYPEAHSNRGAALRDLKRPEDALASYDRAIALKPDYANAHNNRGNVLKGLKRLAEAVASYDKALALKPDLVGAEGMRLHTRMHICDWNNFDDECGHLISSVRKRKANSNPFALLGISSSSDDQLQCAKLWVTEKSPPSRQSIWRGEHYRHDRIRVAYLSADFHQSATSYLMAGLFEHHDKSRFEVTGISIGPEDSDEM